MSGSPPIVQTQQGGYYAVGGEPDVTPETAEEIFRHPLPIRSAKDRSGEFFHFMPGAEPGKQQPTMSLKEQSDKLASSSTIHIPKHMMEVDPRGYDHRWNASTKVRHIESVHLPEYAGWHRRSQGLPVGDHGGPPNNKSVWEPETAPKMVSRGPKVTPLSTVQWRGRDLEWNSNS